MKGKLIGRGRTALIYTWGDGQVLKLYEQGTAVEKVEYEAELGRRIHESGIASPAVHGFAEVEGQPGIIFELINGPTMLQFAAKRPWRIFRAARQFAELQADMHSHRVEGLKPLNGKILARLERISSLTPETRAKLTALLESFPAGEAVCHGDYHPDNLLMSPQGPVIIDWLDANQGHSLYDVARTSYLLSRAALPPATPIVQRTVITAFRRVFNQLYLRRYRQLKPFSKQDFAHWTRIVAAARLTEGIAEEEKQLLAIVNNHF